MSTMTSRLLAAGLIERHVDELELRSNVITLSKYGESLLEKIHHEWREVDREMCAVIGVENADHLATFAGQIRNAFGGFTPGEVKSDAGASASLPGCPQSL